MESNIAKELNCEFKPIVLIKTDIKPENGLEMRANSYGCIMSKVAKVIADRETFIVSKETCSCPGAFPGLGFGSSFDSDEKVQNHATFLSVGLEGAPNKESFEKFLDEKPSARRAFFEQGEHIFSNYEESYNYVSSWASMISEGKYAVFKPLEDLEDDEIPLSVIFTLKPNELSAFLILESSIRKAGDAYLITNQSAACQSIGWQTFSQDKDNQRPVLGLVDLAGRNAVKHWFGDNHMNISTPWELFLELEEASKDSILQSPVWKDQK